jgi:ubiquinone/menaquinone biosynthesis C-methylase UbiE
MQSDTMQEWRESAPYWERHAQTIRQMFTPVTRALIEEAGIREGRAVLDVAGGPGEPSLMIAETVGPSGSVTCTDAVAEMVAAAECEAHRRGLTNVECRQCPADALPFAGDSFDAAVCRFGAMFFPDPLKALGEMLRVTRPGGSLSFAVWHRSDLNPYFYLITNVISRYIETTPAPPGAPDAFRFAELGAIARILVEAGATNVRERVLKFRMEAPVTPAEFWAMRSETSGTLRDKLTGLSEEERASVEQEVEDAARPFFPHGRMSFPAQVIIVTGKKPSQAAEETLSEL